MPQPKSELAKVVDEPITLIDMINPSMVLMDSEKRLKLLLSRDTVIERGSVRLRGVRLIDIPLGWRLAVIRLLSRVCKTRLPDEMEFTELRVNTDEVPSPVASGAVAVGSVNNPIPLIPLTAAEYTRLFNGSGRELHCWVKANFHLRNRAVLGSTSAYRRAA